jgi:hypothetical protein
MANSIRIGGLSSNTFNIEHLTGPNLSQGPNNIPASTLPPPWLLPRKPLPLSPSLSPQSHRLILNTLNPSITPKSPT